MGSSSSKTGRSIRGSLLTTNVTVKELYQRKMEPGTLASGKTTGCMVKANFKSMEVKATTVSGKMVWWMATASKFMEMVESTRVSSWKTKSMGKAPTCGRMGKFIQVAGSMVNNTGKASTLILKEKQRKESGTTVQESNGLMMNKNNHLSIKNNIEKWLIYRVMRENQVRKLTT